VVGLFWREREPERCLRLTTDGSAKRREERLSNWLELTLQVYIQVVLLVLPIIFWLSHDDG
jgi:hypothetical protein